MGSAETSYMYSKPLFLNIYGQINKTIVAEEYVEAVMTLNLSTKVSSSSKGLFKRIHRKVSVSSVNCSKKSNLRISCKVHILCTLCYELH